MRSVLKGLRSVMATGVDEAERLKWLAELALLESPVDPLITQVCDLAAAFFKVDFAFVSLLDDEEAHIFAHHGLAPGKMPRRQALCDTTIRSSGPMVVAETRADPRFVDNALVTGAPHLRFYAGVPLEVAPGIRLGAMCLGDTAPREMSAEQLAFLQSLTALVVGQISHHARKQQLARMAIDMVGRQTILSQAERFARAGGFSVAVDDETMDWTDELHRLFGIDVMEKPTLSAFVAAFSPDAQARLRHGIAALATGDLDELDLEAIGVDATGATRHLHVHAEPRVVPGGSPRVFGIVQDITERKNATAELEWIATHDGLTRLYNRRSFNHRIEQGVDDIAVLGQRVALIMLDIDRFKSINDTLGHDAGDLVLMAVADRLRSAVGDRGLVARIGGDEFAVLVSAFEAEGTVATLATSILLALRKPFIHNSCELSTRATLGVAICSAGTRSATDLFKDADIALYNAKKAGRDGFAFYRPAMRDEMESRLARLASARSSVFAGQIEPFYQPKICLETGRVAGFEALLRWRHPEKGLCAPGEMGDAFADTELAVAIGRGMLYRVVADMVEWRARKLKYHHVAINVAEPEFYAGDYAERLLSCLEMHDLPPEAIEVEVTESVFLGQVTGNVERTLRKLADAGIAIALDDFGTGYASLTHLKRYPVSSIKIDKSFVMEIETDRNAATIVDAVTSLANSLKVKVVAEGIETQAQVDFLRAHDCTMGQGFLFARPMPGSRVPHFLLNWAAGRRDEVLRLAAG